MCATRYAPGAHGSSTARHKLALVIGNSRYESGSNLRNPCNDADDMTSSLQSIGFEVTKGLNLTCEMMDSYLNTFI
ncbi:unnamed protein product, partial [Rotaria sp. Silwood2]